MEGKKIIDAVRFVSKLGGEIEAMMDTLDSLIKSSVYERGKDFKLSEKEIREDSKEDASDWTYISTGKSFGLIPRGSRKNTKAELHITYQIDLDSSGLPCCDDEPLLHVFCWECQLNFSEPDECYMGWPFDEEESEYLLSGDSLWVWPYTDREDGPQWKKRQWAFSVKLVSLNSEEDLKNKVVGPMISMLNGDFVNTALPDNLDGIIRYEENNGKYKRKGEFSAEE